MNFLKKYWIYILIGIVVLYYVYTVMQSGKKAKNSEIEKKADVILSGAEKGQLKFAESWVNNYVNQYNANTGMFVDSAFKAIKTQQLSDMGFTDVSQLALTDFIGTTTQGKNLTQNVLSILTEKYEI